MGCFGGRGKGVDKEQKEMSKQIEKRLMEDKKKYKATHRLLLLGKISLIKEVHS